MAEAKGNASQALAQALQEKVFFFFKIHIFLRPSLSPTPLPCFSVGVGCVLFMCVCVCFFSSSSHMESCQVAALLLLSQQEERQLLERNVNAALQRKMEELQRNLLQVISVSVSGTLAP